MPSLNFKGKALVQNYHLLVPYHELKPVKAKSLTDKASLHDNLVVHGDNLKALKALLPYYHGGVKCIYIDPPYNTGNEGWVYNDNVSSPMMQEWLGKVVDREDLTRHDKWLCMMLPRLKLLRELLSDEGAIFVSIDDIEIHRMRSLLDEVFGEENFVANVVWEKGRKGDAKLFASVHEYVLVYARNKELILSRGIRWKRTKPGVDRVLAKYDGLRAKLKHNHARIREEMMAWYRELSAADAAKAHKHYNWSDERGLYFPADFAGPDDGRESRPRYDIIHPVTKKSCAKPSTGWRWDEERTQEALAEEPPRIHFGPDESTIPNRKTYLKEVTEEAALTVFYKDGRAATLLVEQILGKDAAEVPFPKDVESLADLLGLVADKDSIVLDAFAGSGTTAHAVMNLNQEDNGGRRFVLIEEKEYADHITAERIRRVIKGVPKAKDEALQKGLGGSFSFIEVGNAMQLESLLKATRCRLTRFWPVTFSTPRQARSSTRARSIARPASSARAPSMTCICFTRPTWSI